MTPQDETAPGMDEAMGGAVAAVAAMSPVDRALMEDDQRRSFVRSNGLPDPGPSPLAAELRALRAAREEDKAHIRRLELRLSAVALRSDTAAFNWSQPSWPLPDRDTLVRYERERRDFCRAALPPPPSTPAEEPA